MADEKHNQYYLDWLAQQKAKKEGLEWESGYQNRLEALKLEAQELSEISASILKRYGTTKSISEDELTRMMTDLGFYLDKESTKFIRARSSRELSSLPPSKMPPPKSLRPTVITDHIPVPKRNRKHLSDDPNTGTDNTA